MHDQQLERNLRSALRAEGDRLALTITAAELERRLALRRRHPRLASLGLAAAVAIGLLGLVGVLSGWFDRQTVVNPAPQPSASPASGPSGLSSASPAPVAALFLPSLDDLVTRGDRDAVVLAQESGAKGGQPKFAPTNPSVDLGPLAGPADYEITYACIGRSEASLSLKPVASDGELVSISHVSCNGSIQTASFHASGPARLVTGTETPSSWRFVVRRALAKGPPPALTIRLPEPDAEERVLFTASGQHPDPDYTAIQTGGGIITPRVVGSIPPLDGYRVRVSCAGPAPLRYAIGADNADTGVVTYSMTEVACDGAIHDGRFDIALPNGAPVFVATDDRDAWNLLVTTDPAPVSIAPNENGWALKIATGPDLTFDAQPNSLVSLIENPVREIRVVVSCFGGHSVKVDVAGTGSTAVFIGSFTALCEPGQATTSSATFSLPTSDGFEITAVPDTKMWVAITVQTRAPASPPP
jgi:hypothetical protein